MLQEELEPKYPDGITQAEHIAHDMGKGRSPEQSSVEQFLRERYRDGEVERMRSVVEGLKSFCKEE